MTELLRVTTLAVFAGLLGLLSASSSARETPEDETRARVFSGPQKNEKLLPFKVTGVYDELAGKEVSETTTFKLD